MRRFLPALLGALLLFGVAPGVTRIGAIWAQQTGGPNVGTQGVTPTGGTAFGSLSDIAARVLSVKDFGAKCDGSTDDQAAFTAASSYFNTNGGGSLLIPAGTCVTGHKIVLYSGMRVIGMGPGTSTIKLANSTNDSVLESLNFLSVVGTSTVAPVSGVEIADLTIDGNSANNASPGSNSGIGIAYYGRVVHIHGVYIKNTYRTGLWTENGAPGCGGCVSPWDGHIERVTIDTTGEHGWFNNLSDIHANDINVRNPSQNSSNSFDGVQCGSKGACRITNLNVWYSGNYSSGTYPRYSLNIDGSSTVSNVSLEDGASADLFVNGNFNTVTGCYAYNVPNANTTGIVQINGGGNQVQCSITPVSGNAATVGLLLTNSASSNIVSAKISSTTNGLVNFSSDGGYNTLNIDGLLSSGTVMVGTPATTDTISFNSNSVGAGLGGLLQNTGAGLPNILLNGLHIVDQRNEGSATPTTNDAQYIDDGWKIRKTLTSATLSSAQGQITDAPAGYPYSTKLTIGTGASLSASDLLAIAQNVEGPQMLPSGWATSGARVLSVSVWLKSSVSGATVDLTLQNAAQSHSYISECTLNGTSWTECFFSVPGDTGGTWTFTPGVVGLRLWVMLGCGSTFQGSAATWNASNVLCTTNQTNIAATSSATFQLGPIKAEFSPMPTPISIQDPARELLAMKRFYQKTFNEGTKPAQNAAKNGAICTVAQTTTASTVNAWWQFNPPMVKNPTITTYNPSAGNANWRGYNATPYDNAVSVDPQTALGHDGVQIVGTTAPTAAGDVTCIHAQADTAF
jgi:hypothetical protein